MATVEVTTDFFDFIFGEDEGYVCLATTQPPADRSTFVEAYFKWPDEKEDVTNYVEKMAPTHNVYYCVNLLSMKKRIKANAIPQNLLWADLDTCPPDKLDIPPQIVVESSPKRFQGIWRLTTKLDPMLAENYNRRLAYHYAPLGVDKSGHDLTQLLRVPGSFNFKYGQDENVPEVRLLTSLDALLPVEMFDNLPVADDMPMEEIVGMPDVDTLPQAESVIYSYIDKLKQTAFARYFGEEPTHDWSASLWRLINTCLEVNMTAEETFAVAIESKCNKYARDGRPISHLWREILKAELKHKNIQTVMGENKMLAMPVLLSAYEEEKLGGTIMDQYKAWAVTATDAVEEYHELACAILMSGCMAKSLRLSTGWGKIVPNLWGLVLGDSTLTRKTTAMDMAMDLLSEVDRDLVVATDATPEGIVTTLALRPKMVSIFYRDEITGWLESIQRKEYLASLPEILTKMYDVPKFYPRQLRKETITVVEPIFIFFGGGILDKTYSLVDEHHFLSGFLPRFLVVTGRADIARVRGTGPPESVETNARDDLLTTFQHLHTVYSPESIEIEAAGQMIPMAVEREVTLTPEAWEKFREMEAKLIKSASDSPHSLKALPTFQRMGFSMLKLSMLIAAARQGEDDVVVELNDLLNAAYYIQRWGRHMVDFIKNSGQSKDESTLQAVYRTVERNPGIMRGQLMQRHYLNKRQMDDIQGTLDERFMVQLQRKGKAVQFWPIGR
jgi:RepB DNA-primase from phage plasmid/Protein of unknown function (DUF3987)